VPARHPFRLEELGVRRSVNGGDGSKSREQGGSDFRSDAGYRIELGREIAALAHDLAAPVREPMSLVPRPGQKEELGRVRAQRNWILLTWQIDAIHHPLAEHTLLLLGQADNRQLVEAEIARGRERHRQLAAPAIDHDQIGKVPHAVAIFPRALSSRQSGELARLTQLHWLAAEDLLGRLE
jgi:hypothetical protein